jgi:hypothetical protein
MFTPRTFLLAALAFCSALVPVCAQAETEPVPAAAETQETPGTNTEVLAAVSLALPPEPAATSSAPLLAAATPAPTPAPDHSTASTLDIPPFSEYEIILSRKPFGNPPLLPDKPLVVDNTAVNQAQEEQKLAKQVNMVAVNKTPSGNTAVGFIDKSDKPERSYYLNVGATLNGFTVVEASYAEETATLTKDGVTITLKLGEGLIKGGGATPPPAAAPTPMSLPTAVTAHPPTPFHGREPAFFQPPMGTNMPASASTALRTLNSESFRQRLTRRREETEASAAARNEQQTLDAQAQMAKITKEELDKGKREINLNLIRQGMNPLSPITLTPEEDAEMVKLGVFQE